MTKSIKRIMAVLLLCVLTISVGVHPVHASENTITLSDYMSEEAIAFMSKLSTVYDVFDLDEYGKLTTNISMVEIKARAGFTDDEMIMFENMMLFNEDNPATSGGEQNPNTRIKVKNWKLYFTYDEVMMYFHAAAMLGSAAITAAISALASTVSPGVGTVLGVIAGYIVSADLAYLVLRAAAQQKGIYIGITWDGIFPVYDQGTW